MRVSAVATFWGLIGIACPFFSAILSQRMNRTAILPAQAAR